MRNHQICIRLNAAQFAHFESFIESEGCKTVTELIRKCIFNRWPMKKSSISTASSEHLHSISGASQAPKQESFPHTPFKEYNNNNNISNACAREEKPKKPKSTEPKFVPPTLDEVREYIAAKGYTFDAEHFWSFYTAKGWRVGSHVMKSWHAACTTWQ